MDLDELRALLAVAETGSVLAASDRLKLPRATVRRRLDTLEARVGAPLVYRGPSGALLTEAGRSVAARARTILDEAAALLASAREEGSSVGGTLRVLLPVGLPPHLLLPVLQALRAAHPRLHVHARLSEDPVGAPLDDVDLAFHWGDRVTGGAWVTRVVLPMREELVASPAYLEARGEPRTAADLVHHELYTWARPGADPTLLPAETGGIPIEPALVTADVHSLRLSALRGDALVFLPNPGLPDPGYPPDALRTVLPDLVRRDCPIRLLVPEAMADAPKVRRILTELEPFLSPESSPSR